ncbi:MAG: hypothetical protein NT119_01565, partial [Actinobacteria bacterium]|nr:hypothetical protein [Actinomycetota bacterium]
MSRKLSVLIAGLLLALLPVAPALAVAPTITGVTSSTADGAYKVGSAIIPIQVTFNQPVTVIGFPTLELETGVTDRLATYFSGSGTTILTFNYSISIATTPDTSTDLDYKATNSLVAAGPANTIKNVGGEDATLTLATPGALNVGSLANSKNIVIDNTAPTASVVLETIGSAGNATARSTELGNLYLVRDTNSPTSVSQIMALPANERTTATTVVTINSDTNVPAAMLTSGSYRSYAADIAGNLSAASALLVIIDALAPSVGMLPVSTALSNTSRIAVQSNETGKAYLVRDTVVVLNVASITGSGDANYNEVTITTANTSTSMATTTLGAGNYKLYAADAFFNLSAPFSTLVTIGTDSSAPTVSTATP